MERFEGDNDEEVEKFWPLPLTEEADTRRPEPHEEFWDDVAEEQRPHPRDSFIVR